MMDGFEYNKIAAAVLIAFLVAIVSIIFGEELIHTKKLKKDSYEIVVVHTAQSSASGAKDEPEDILPFLAKADIKKGEDSFKKCIQCHTVGKGEPHKIGPNLWGIVMRKIASLGDFAYSASMKEKKDDWTYENLSHLLFKPRNFAPGTKMSFVGIFDAQERANVIAYLRSLSDSPVPLPTVSEKKQPPDSHVQPKK